jgi:hypothetical protein
MNETHYNTWRVRAQPKNSLVLHSKFLSFKLSDGVEMNERGENGFNFMCRRQDTQFKECHSDRPSVESGNIIQNCTQYHSQNLEYMIKFSLQYATFF